MTPLTSWMCDYCGQLIERADLGNVIWKKQPSGKEYGHLIVHKTFADNPSSPRCDSTLEADYPANLSIEDMIGPLGLARLLGDLSRGPIDGTKGAVAIEDFDAWIDLFRRLQVPYYEEARPHFNSEGVHHWFSDASEVTPYLPDTLQRIATGEYEHG